MLPALPALPALRCPADVLYAEHLGMMCLVSVPGVNWAPVQPPLTLAESLDAPLMRVIAPTDVCAERWAQLSTAVLVLCVENLQGGVVGFDDHLARHMHAHPTPALRTQGEVAPSSRPWLCMQGNNGRATALCSSLGVSRQQVKSTLAARPARGARP